MNGGELREILALRVLIARAAAKDSLNWWDDEALTDAGLALAGRLFSRQPERAAIRLALRAAKARHDAMLARFPGVVHLFWFGGELELALDNAISDVGCEIPGALESLADLAQVLALYDVAEAPQSIGRWTERCVEIDLSPVKSPLHQARLLAAGYLEGESGRPVFPYARLNAGARQ